MSQLIVTSASHAISNQRKGRAGRIMPGNFYRLCTQSDYFNEEEEEGEEKGKKSSNTVGRLVMMKHSIPEIQRCDLRNAILKLTCLGIDNILNFNFLSEPPILSITYALEMLFAMHAIDKNGRLKEPIGKILAQIPCDIKIASMLIAGGLKSMDCLRNAKKTLKKDKNTKKNNSNNDRNDVNDSDSFELEYACSEEMLSVGAMLSHKTVWNKPYVLFFVCFMFFVQWF